MSEIKKLRALLTDARVLMRHGPDCPIVRCDCRMRETALRIDAALAESPSGDMKTDVAEQRQVFIRGAKAMREAAANFACSWCGPRIRALPTPEDK